jgi:quinol monooxygenase YgiN
MSAHVVTELKTRPEHTEQVVSTLRKVLPDSLVHDGCVWAICLRRDQDDPTRIVSFTQWASRRDYEYYLAWRTGTGMTGEIGELLTEPMSIEYFDDIVTVTR